MSRVSPNTIPPVFENVREKFSTLDFEKLPTGEYHLNFRPPVILTARDTWSVIGRMLLGSLLSIPIGCILSSLLGPLVSSPGWFVFALFIGGMAVLARATRLIPGAPNVPADRDAPTLLLVPLIVWAVVALAASTGTPSGAFWYFLVLGMPAVVFTADRVATHTVYWMTAHPTLPLEAAHSVRQAWHQRFRRSFFDEFPEADMPESTILDTRLATADRAYSLGILWVLAAVLVPSLAVLLFSQGQTPQLTGMTMIAAIVGSLTLVATVRAMQHPDALLPFWMAVVHFLQFTIRGQAPGWVFQSPCGSHLQRNGAVLFTLLLLVIAIGACADGFSYFLLCPVNAPLIPPDVLEAFGDDTGYSRFAIAAGAALSGESYLGLCLLLQLLTAVVVPGLVLLVAAFILTGPALAAHHQVLEQEE